MKITLETLDGLICDIDVPMAVAEQDAIKRECRTNYEPKETHYTEITKLRIYKKVGFRKFRELH